MARPLRDDCPGAVHHLYDRATGGLSVFRDDRDRQEFTRRLIKYRDQAQVTLLAHCLMGTHFHLVPQTGPTPLSIFMHDLLTSYTRYYNERWLTRGHLFQGRFGGRRCKSDGDVRGVIRYVHLNPVADGFVERPEDWQWSSHNAYLSGSSPVVDVERALEFFGTSGDYRSFMAERRYKDERLSLEEVALSVATGDEIARLKSAARDREVSELRRRFILEARRFGYRNSDLAKYLGRSTAYVSMVARGIT